MILDDDAVPAGARPLILLDVSRLVARVARAAPTGIDRVELAYARHFALSRRFETRFVACAGERIRMLPDGLARRLIAWIEATWAGRSAERGDGGFARVARFLGVEGEPMPAAPVPVGVLAPHRPGFWIDPVGRLLGNPVRLWARQALEPVIAAHSGPVIYLHVSHHNLQKPEPFKALKAAGDVRMAYMVHDLIPIECPEFSRPGDDAKHRRRMETVADTADLVITNSHDTALRLARHLGTIRAPWTVASHLGLDNVATVAVPWRKAPPPYFVVVSTIEARKNHYFLLALWRALAERHSDRTPKLVVVGRRGWEVENVIDLLERSPAIRAHVLEAGSLGDAALAAVRAGSRAVLMPSLAEGYGLPVAESLAAGVPVIASDIAPHGEIGGGVAELLDPLDGPGWMRAIEDYAEATSPRREAQLGRVKGYRAPDWPTHFATVEAALVDLARR